MGALNVSTLQSLAQRQHVLEDLIKQKQGTQNTDSELLPSSPPDLEKQTSGTSVDADKTLEELQKELQDNTASLKNEVINMGTKYRSFPSTLLEDKVIADIYAQVRPEIESAPALNRAPTLNINKASNLNQAPTLNRAPTQDKAPSLNRASTMMREKSSKKKTELSIEDTVDNSLPKDIATQFKETTIADLERRALTTSNAFTKKYILENIEKLKTMPSPTLDEMETFITGLSDNVVDKKLYLVKIDIARLQQIKENNKEALANDPIGTLRIDTAIQLLKSLPIISHEKTKEKTLNFINLLRSDDKEKQPTADEIQKFIEIPGNGNIRFNTYQKKIQEKLIEFYEKDNNQLLKSQNEHTTQTTNETASQYFKPLDKKWSNEVAVQAPKNPADRNSHLTRQQSVRNASALLDNVKELGSVGTVVGEHVLSTVTPKSGEETKLTKNTVADVSKVTDYMQKENPQPISIMGLTDQTKSFYNIKRTIRNDLTAQLKNDPGTLAEATSTASISQYLLYMRAEWISQEIQNPSANPLYLKTKCELIENAVTNLKNNATNNPPDKIPANINDILIKLERGLENDAVSKNQNPILRSNIHYSKDKEVLQGIREIASLRTKTIEPAIQILEQKNVNKAKPRLIKQKSVRQINTEQLNSVNTNNNDVTVDLRLEILKTLDANLTAVQNKDPNSDKKILSTEEKILMTDQSLALIKTLREETTELAKKGVFTATKDPLEKRCNDYYKKEPRIETMKQALVISIAKQNAPAATAGQDTQPTFTPQNQYNR